MKEYLAPTYGEAEGGMEMGGGGAPPAQMASAGMPESRPPQRKVCAAHVGFKAAALLLYIFSGLFFSSEYVVTFVAVVLLSALDLWTVRHARPARVLRAYAADVHARGGHQIFMWTHAHR
eukprot:scaffold101622_cov31-Tisochrysis_lutea.AAC.1